MLSGGAAAFETERLSLSAAEAVADDSAAAVRVRDPGPVARIVNGTQTDDYLAVGFVDPLGCTGTLISSTHVLTAAHCLEGVDDTEATFRVNGRTYQSSAVTLHPDYDPDEFDRGNDIAVITLDQPVAGVEPAALFRQAPRVGMMLTLVGFGEGGTSTDGFDPDDTGKQVGQTRLDGVTAEHITWTFDSHEESNTAAGDSGGPAFVTVDGEDFIIGVTSGGAFDAHALGEESFDTRIDIHAEWIDSILANADPNPPQPVDDHADRPNRDSAAITLNGAGAGAVNGTFETVGDRDAFSFTLDKAGQTTVALAGRGRPVDTYLRVYDQRRRLVAENDGVGNRLDSRVTASLAPGKYFAVAGTADDASEGNYRLRVRHQPDNVEPLGPYAAYQNNRTVAIRSNRPNTVSTGIRVRDLPGRINDVNVTVDVDHSWVADLRIVLVSPGGDRTVLVNHKGGGGDDFERTTFDSASFTHVNNASAPYRGTFRPAHTLNRLNGQDPNGMWRLEVIDRARDDGGELNFWRLEVATDAAPETTSVRSTTIAAPRSSRTDVLRQSIAADRGIENASSGFAVERPPSVATDGRRSVAETSFETVFPAVDAARAITPSLLDDFFAQDLNWF